MIEQQIEREKLTRSMKWELAEKLASENLDKVNRNCPKIFFSETLYSRYIKRILDISVSFISLMLTLPINVFIAIITLFDVGRPILFKQERIGKNEKKFTLIKFRNMRNTTNERGELLPPNQRVTNWGRIVRETSLDELLNFWSILKGDMSVIGPRPLSEPYLKRFNERHLARFLVKPGLECPPMDIKTGSRTWDEQFENDVWYVEHISFITDVKLLINLIKMTFNKKYSQIRGNATRGDFLGYSEDGKAITQYDIPDQYLIWLKNQMDQSSN